MKKFSLIYTSSRLECVEPVINKWVSMSSDPSSVEVCLAIDGDKTNTFDGIADKVCIVEEPPYNCVKGWNLAATESSGDILIAISDDMEPIQNWDDELYNLCPEKWFLEDYAVHVSDGYLNDLCTLPILTRKRYERFGYLFYPQYESMFSDTEFTYCAKMEGALLEAKHLVFEHNHYSCGKRGQDDVDTKHASSDRWSFGENLYNYRLSMGFPIDCGPNGKDYECIKCVTADDVAVHILAIKNDFYLSEIIIRLYEEGCSNFYVASPTHYWSGKESSEGDRDSVSREIALVESKIENIRIKHSIIYNGDLFSIGIDKYAIEAKTRNRALDIIRGDGFKHTFVVDGDELWPQGFVSNVLSVINNINPHAILSGIVPVIGTPGYPIKDAKDKCLIYIASHVNFSSCRSVSVECNNLPYPKVMHFTATRTSLEEVITKHLNSGHYGDPDYDFDGWIKNIVGRVHPGMRNVHMYKKFQIWPSVGSWTAQEYNSIPENIRKHIAPPMEYSPINTNRKINDFSLQKKSSMLKSMKNI